MTGVSNSWDWTELPSLRLDFAGRRVKLIKPIEIGAKTCWSLRLDFVGRRVKVVRLDKVSKA